MSESFQNDRSEEAKRRLSQACRTKDTSLRLAWAITIGEAILLGVLAVALMDYWLMLPVWIRSLGALVLASLAAFGIFRLLKFFRRPTKLKEVALDVEAQRPDLGCEISTAAEYLSGERQTTKEYEPELVAALEAKAADGLAGPQIPYQRRLLRPGVILFVTLLGLLIFVVMAPVAFTALTRAALPFSRAHYTQLLVTPGSTEIPVGKDLEITNLFSGREPKDPELHWQQAGSTRWERAALTRRASDGSYLYSFPNLRTDFKYRVTGNDAASETYEVKTYLPPEVKDLDLRIEEPAYTQLKPITQTTADITAVRASTVQVRIVPSVPLSQAKLRFSTNSEALALKANEQGMWTGTFQITKDTDYWIELADVKGHRGGDDKPHHIKAILDTAPKVEIETPGQDTHAAATNRVPVRISAADDFGVADMQIVFHKLGGASQSAVVRREGEEKGTVTGSAEMDLSALNLKEFEVVAYHAEARDNNTLDGPGVGKSPVYFVEITNVQSPEGSKTNQPPQPMEKANLLVIQKQIIADTSALAPDAATNKFSDLALRQRDARDFAQIYLSTLTGKAPAPALSEMQSAISEMESASVQLGNQKQSLALVPEESALAHLYQVLKLMPQLENLPTQPKPEQQLAPTNQLAIVLEAIKEKKKEQADDKPLEDALQQAQNLVQAQSKLNIAMRHPEQNTARGQGQGQGQAQPQNNSSPKNQKGDQPGKNGDNAKPPHDQLAKADADQSKEAGQGTEPGDSKDSLANSEKSNAQGEGQGQGKGESAKDEPAKAEQGKGQGKGEGKGQGESKDQAKADQAKGKGQGQGQGEGQGKGEKQMAKADQAKGKGKGQGQGQGQGKGQGQGQPQGEGQGEQDPSQPEPNEPPPLDPTQLAEQEQQLSKQAQALADKLERLAGNDKRLGHDAGQNAKLGGQKIAKASEEIKQGNFGAAGVNGYQGELALRKVTEQLQRVLKERPELTDVANEDAPKQYESLISEYFKKLSHAE